MQNSKIELTENSIREWLARRVATYVQNPLQPVEHDIPFGEYGLDSVYALTLAGEIEDHFGLILDPTVMWDYPTINLLTKALLEDLASA